MQKLYYELLYGVVVLLFTNILIYNSLYHISSDKALCFSDKASLKSYAQKIKNRA